jgi:hypothetical protein
MVTPGVSKLHFQRFWDDEYKHLAYIREPFNDPESVAQWTVQGYLGPFSGVMCDMRQQQPSWNQRFIDLFAASGWKDIGTSYYRMDTGVILPVHIDLYRKYIELFDLKGKEHSIRRAIVFLEDWAPGHYFEANGIAYTDWRAGDCFEWIYDVPHAAANIGLTSRYTLQITGHI